MDRCPGTSFPGTRVRRCGDGREPVRVDCARSRGLGICTERGSGLRALHAHRVSPSGRFGVNPRRTIEPAPAQAGVPRERSWTARTSPPDRSSSRARRERPRPRHAIIPAGGDTRHPAHRGHLQQNRHSRANPPGVRPVRTSSTIRRRYSDHRGRGGGSVDRKGVRRPAPPSPRPRYDARDREGKDRGARFEVADRIHVHHLGKRIAVLNPKAVDMSDTVAIMTGAVDPPGAG